MKSPEELRNKLRSQWLSGDHREQRMLSNIDWPLRLSIGKPAAKTFSNQLSKVKQHLTQWRQQKLGRVEWSSVKYQSATSPVDIPISWLIESPDDWVLACADLSITTEFNLLSQIIKQVDPMFHQLIVRHRSLWSNKNNNEQESIIQCCHLAMRLESGMAMQLPLRALPIEGIDSKFFEIHQGLITRLLNIRFSGALHEQNLEGFLGASETGDHWLLIKPLANDLLPFELIRLRASELSRTKLPASNLLIIENEQCHYLLPKLKNTIAILGSGLNLSWLSNADFNKKNIFYWGDIDTWGLRMLAMARQYQPHLKPILMDFETYHQHIKLAVLEPKNAGSDSPRGLTREESDLYQILLETDLGRLEQERLSSKVIEFQLLNQII